MIKRIDLLKIADWRTSPVWEFVTEREVELEDETYVRPVSDLPVGSLDGRVVASGLFLANGNIMLGTLCNLNLSDSFRTKHFLTVSLFLADETEFHLARYFDSDWAQRGPAALGSSLKLNLEEVFPIRYDISAVAKGNTECVRGVIMAEPLLRLSTQELIALALPG